MTEDREIYGLGALRPRPRSYMQEIKLDTVLRQIADVRMETSSQACRDLCDKLARSVIDDRPGLLERTILLVRYRSFCHEPEK